MSFDTGTFTVQSLTIAADTSGTSTTGPTGTLILGSPNSTGIFTDSDGILLGDFTNSSVSATAVATLTVAGGSVSIDGNITNASTHGSTTATLNLNGGTLNMNGYAIGGNGSSGNGSVAVNLPASGQSATISNLGGTGINGAGLTMNGGGALTLAGSNTFAGNVSVTSGTLTLASSASLTSPNISVSSGATANINGVLNGSTPPAVTDNGTTNFGAARAPAFSIARCRRWRSASTPRSPSPRRSPLPLAPCWSPPHSPTPGFSI